CVISLVWNNDAADPRGIRPGQKSSWSPCGRYDLDRRSLCRESRRRVHVVKVFAHHIRGEPASRKCRYPIGIEAIEPLDDVANPHRQGMRIAYRYEASCLGR